MLVEKKVEGTNEIVKSVLPLTIDFVNFGPLGPMTLVNAEFELAGLILYLALMFLPGIQIQR